MHKMQYAVQYYRWTKWPLYQQTPETNLQNVWQIILQATQLPKASLRSQGLKACLQHLRQRICFQKPIKCPHAHPLRCSNASVPWMELQQSFTHPGDLKKHVKTHSKKWWRCEVAGCNYKNGDWRNLKSHKISHSTKKSFVCKYCEKKIYVEHAVSAPLLGATMHSSQTLRLTKLLRSYQTERVPSS